MWQFHIGGWHRYTRWTGRPSHQTSDLSHPHNLLLKGCDLLLLLLIPGSRWEGSDLPSYHQTTKVTLTESSPERSGIHAYCQTSNTVHSDYACSLRGIKTAKVEGLWLANRPKHLVPEHPNDSPKALPCPLSTAPTLQWENHCACALELPWFVHVSTGVHARTQTPQKPQTPLSPSQSLFHACDILSQAPWCALVPELNLLTFLKNTGINIGNEHNRSANK